MCSRNKGPVGNKCDVQSMVLLNGFNDCTNMSLLSIAFSNQLMLTICSQPIVMYFYRKIITKYFFTLVLVVFLAISLLIT
jgi:hypothetical protein